MDDLSSEFASNHMPARMFVRQEPDTMFNMTLDSKLEGPDESDFIFYELNDEEKAENSMDYSGHATQNTFMLQDAVSFQPQQHQQHQPQQRFTCFLSQYHQQQQQQHHHHQSNGLQPHYQSYSQHPPNATTTTSLSNSSHTETIFYNQSANHQYQSQLNPGAPTIVSLTTVATDASSAAAAAAASAAATATTDGHLLPQREVRLETFDTAFNKQPQLNGTGPGAGSSLPMHISTIADDDHSSSSNDDGSSHSYGTGYLSANFTRTADGQFQCGYCNKLFTLLQHMRVHMHMHEGASGTPSPPQLIATNGVYAVAGEPSSNGSAHTIQSLDNVGALSPQTTTTTATYAPLTMQPHNGHHDFYHQASGSPVQHQHQQLQHHQQQHRHDHPHLEYQVQIMTANHMQTELTPPISPPTPLKAGQTTVASQFPNGTIVTTIGGTATNTISTADALCYQPLAPIASITTTSGFNITPPMCSGLDTSVAVDTISSTDAAPSYQSLANIATIQPAAYGPSTAQTIVLATSTLAAESAPVTSSPAAITTISPTISTTGTKTAAKPKRRKKSATAIAATAAAAASAAATTADASGAAASPAAPTGSSSGGGGGASFEFPCQTCGQNYRTQRNLDQHMLEHTQPGKLFQCEYCPKTFKVQSSMKIHMNVHLQEKPFKCTECDKSYTQQSNLRSHMQCHTKDGLKHACDKCPKTFTSLSSLKSHKQAHSGQKPHKCTQCGKTYTQSSSLKVHMNIHSGAKPYECEVCLKKFSDPSNFRKHKSTTHNL